MMLIRSDALHGGLAGSADIENLQRALTALSQKTGNAATNPGAIDGVLGPQTMVALQAAISQISSSLPSWAYLALQAAMIGGANTSTAKGYVGQYATMLAVAVNTAAAKLPAGPATQSSIVLQTPWYKTQWGIGLLVLGAVVGGWALFFRNPSPSA